MAYSNFQSSVVQSQSSARASFIRRTYLHLALAILLFAGLEMYFFTTTLPQAMLSFAVGGKYNWLMILGGFMVVGWMARGFAQASRSPVLQYLGLVGFVAAEAVIFLPILTIAQVVTHGDAISTAGIMTLLLFVGLTVTAFTSGTDFSFLRGILTIGGIIALGAIVCAALFGVSLGMWFSVIMIGLAAVAILHDTSRIMRDYDTDQHVSAALELFASVAMMFWYILRVLIALRGRN